MSENELLNLLENVATGMSVDTALALIRAELQYRYDAGALDGYRDGYDSGYADAEHRYNRHA